MRHVATGWEVFSGFDFAEVVNEVRRDWIRDSYTPIALLHIVSSSVLLRLKRLQRVYLGL